MLFFIKTFGSLKIYYKFAISFTKLNKVIMWKFYENFSYKKEDVIAPERNKSQLK